MILSQDSSLKTAGKSCKQKPCRNECKGQRTIESKKMVILLTQVKKEENENLIIKKTYTVTACPPNVYSMLVAPVK